MIAINQETLHHSLETSVKLEHFHFVLIGYTSKAINVIHEVKTYNYTLECKQLYISVSNLFFRPINLTNTKIYVNPFTIKTTVA